MKLQTPSLDKSCHWVPSIHKKNLSKFGGRLGGAQGLRRLLIKAKIKGRQIKFFEILTFITKIL